MTKLIVNPYVIKEFASLINTLKQSGAHFLADDIGILQSIVLKAQLANTNLSLDELEKHYFRSVGR